MRKVILLACIFAGIVSASAEEFTMKGLIAKATSKEGVQRVTELLATPAIAKIVEGLNEDLKIEIQSNKLVVTSQSNFDYIEIDEKKLPRKASVKIGIFGIGVKVTKIGGVLTVQGI